MGRPRRLSGATKIANAEELFRQSVAEGKPDYGYVALAIGDRPFDPPAWAVLECIELRGDTSRGAMRGHDGPASKHAMRNILDEIVRYYLAAELNHEKATGISVWRDDVRADSRYNAPPLRQAIIAACRGLGTRENQIGSANDDWFRDVREAWDWEQHHDALVSRQAGSGDFSATETYHELIGWKVTRRIARVLEELQEAAGGAPADIGRALWIADQLRD